MKKVYKALNRSLRLRNKYYNRYIHSGKKIDYEQWQVYVAKCEYICDRLSSKVIFHCEQLNLGVVR
jgi:hypothetical protein